MSLDEVYFFVCGGACGLLLAYVIVEFI